MIRNSLRKSFSTLLMITAVSALMGCGTREVTVQTTTSNSTIAEPILDTRLSREDFGFPSQPPSLLLGKRVFQDQCLKCHTASYFQDAKVQHALNYTTPIDYYILLSTGNAEQVQLSTSERESFSVKNHPGFKNVLDRDQRWAVIFYSRYLAGAGDKQFNNAKGQPVTVDSIFGGNCAVCHGKRGFADGPLYSGHPSSHELNAGKVHVGLFQPPPANFHDYRRMYNRTDAQLFKYISEGIYPSAMPAWMGNVDKDYSFTFDDNLLWKLVRHVRSFAYTSDLPDAEPIPPGPIPPRPSSLHPLIPPVESAKLSEKTASAGESQSKETQSAKALNEEKSTEYSHH